MNNKLKCFICLCLSMIYFFIYSVYPNEYGIKGYENFVMVTSLSFGLNFFNKFLNYLKCFLEERREKKK